MTSKATSYLKHGLILAPWLLAGCSRAPTFDIVGSLFPAWLVCSVIGVILTLLSHWLLLRLKITLIFPTFVYLALAALFTFLLWLVFFN